MTRAALQALLGMSLTTTAAYAAGRLHQWYAHARDLDQAWREGHEAATRTLFPVAARAARRRPSPRPGIGTRLDSATIGRHSVAGRRLRG
jgi:hypothetical protein